MSDDTYYVEVKRGDEVIYTNKFEIREVGGDYSTTHIKDFIIRLSRFS